MKTIRISFRIICFPAFLVVLVIASAIIKIVELVQGYKEKQQLTFLEMIKWYWRNF